MLLLEGEDFKTACTLILESYDQPTLQEVVRIRLLLRLDWIVPNAGMAQQVAQLLDWAGRHRLSGRLLKELAEYPPPRLKLRPLADKYPPDPDEPGRPLDELVNDAVGALNEVPAVLNDDALRKQFTPFTQAYQEAAGRIKVLRIYKRLHDCLQAIQLQFREICNTADDLGDRHLFASSSLNTYSDALDHEVKGDRVDDGVNDDALDDDLTRDAGGGGTKLGLDKLIMKLENPGPEQTWVRILGRVIEQFRAAAGARDPKMAEPGIRDLKGILNRDIVRIHEKIIHQYEEIPLSALVFSLRLIQEMPVSPETRTRVARGLESLEAVQLKLGRLVGEHTAWQNLDNSLRVTLDSWYEMLALERRRSAARAAQNKGKTQSIQSEDEESQTVYANRLLEDWLDVAEKWGQVRLCAPAGRRLDRLNEYSQAIAASREKRDFGGVFDAFEPFAQEALRRFVDVDKLVLKLADDLTPIRGPLKRVVEVLQQ